MKFHTDIEQNSVDWAVLRSGKVTASEMDAIISPLGKAREGEGVTTYLAQKLCEKWTGGPLAQLNVFDVEQGRILEERARPAFEFHTGLEVSRVAFVETDCGRAGCSPDGMIGRESGVEIKCPRLDTHCRYLMQGALPKEYAAQVQGSMFVTGTKEWHFFSYNRALPPLHIVVKRDEKFHTALSSALESFLNQFDAYWARLIELNGGPPSRLASKQPIPTSKQQPTCDTP